MANDEILDFLDDDAGPVKPVQRQVKSEQRVEAAATNEEIDSQLASMTKRTTIEELAKRGKTKNIKTLSERNLKQWIHEALRRVISNSTIIDSAEADRMLADTRKELSSIMAERQAEANNRAADARKLAELTAQQQHLAGRIAELEQALKEAQQERDQLHEQVRDLDAELASHDYTGGDEALTALRQELAHAKEKQAQANQEGIQLRRNLGKQLVASTEVVTALLAIDQRFYNGRHAPAEQQEGHQEDAEAEDAFFADQKAASAIAAQVAEDLAAIHEQVSEMVPTVSEGAEGALAADRERLQQLIWNQVHEELMDDLQGQLDEAEQALAAAQAQAGASPDLAQLQQALSEAQRNAEQAQSRAQQAEAALEEARAALAAAEANKEASQEDSKGIAKLEEDLEESQRQVEALTAERDRLQALHDQEQKDLAISQGAQASLRRQLQRSQDELAELKSQASQASADPEQLQALEKTCAEQRQALQEQAEAQEGLQQSLQEAEQEGKDWQERCQAQQQQYEQDKAVADEGLKSLEKALQQAQQQGKDWEKRCQAAAAEAAEVPSLRQRLRELQETLAHRAPLSETPAEAQVAVCADEVALLQGKLNQARAIMGAQDGCPYEDQGGNLVPRKPGLWLSCERDAKGRLQVMRTVGDRWSKVGRNKDITQPSNLIGQPQLMARGDKALATWCNAEGMAQQALLDNHGKLVAEPLLLGPTQGTPALSRGAGDRPPFCIVTDPQGCLHLHEMDAQAPLHFHQQYELPLAQGLACAWFWALENSRHVAWRDQQGAIHELLELQGTWSHACLSTHSGAPPAAADPIGYAPADHEHVLYLGTDGHIHEICFDGHTWRHHDLHQAAGGAPAASSSPSAAYVDGQHCVVYRGVDGHAHCLRLRRDWRYHSLQNLGPIHEGLSFSSCGDTGAILYTNQREERCWARFKAHDPSQLLIEKIG